MMIPLSGDMGVIEVPIFSYPEFSIEWNQVEFATLDYTHILTNIRGHILKNRYDFCKWDHYRELADNRPDLLSLAFVYDVIDQQNAAMAIRMFDHDIKEYFISKGYTESAHFVYLVCKWHSACDKCRLSADFRVGALYEMYEFLMQGVNFNGYPSKLSQRHFRGMPMPTYEALLQNINTHIQLYQYAHGNTYNAHSISTLANESFFSDLTWLDKESPFYPKACNIPKLVGKVVQLNYYKHKANKSYSLQPTAKGTYPVHVFDQELTLETGDTQHIYKNHFFDIVDTHMSYRSCKTDLSTGLNPHRGVHSVCRYYKTDESTVDPQKRARMKAADIDSPF